MDGVRLCRRLKWALRLQFAKRRLRPECADRYPTLPARMWTSAARLAGLVARKGRTLPEADFEFRGGFAQLIGPVDRAHPHW
jgi:hypothetical protein